MHRTRVLLSILLVSGVLAISACSVSLPQGTSGSIALIPFWDEEQGVQGVRPLEGWTKEAQLVQGAIPMAGTDAMALLLAGTDLTAMPESTGRYTGKAFTWELYSFETHLQDVPVGTVRVDLAIAEDGSTTYSVALVVLPDAYSANPALFDTVFTHALYALEPME
jgi:hypothetical protein